MKEKNFLKEERKKEHDTFLKTKEEEAEENKINKGIKKRWSLPFLWYDYIIIILITLIVIGICFVIGYEIYKDHKKTSWSAFGFGFGGIVTYLIIGYFRNLHAINFYNDKRMRYRKTYTVLELNLWRARYIVFISSILIILVGLIIMFIV